MKEQIFLRLLPSRWPDSLSLTFSSSIFVFSFHPPSTSVIIPFFLVFLSPPHLNASLYLLFALDRLPIRRRSRRSRTAQLLRGISERVLMKYSRSTTKSSFVSQSFHLPPSFVRLSSSLSRECGRDAVRASSSWPISFQRPLRSSFLSS